MGIKISMQREVKERIRKEIIEAAQQYAEEYEIENYTDTSSALNCVYAEFKNQFGWKIKQIGEHNAFIEWLKGLPMQFDYSYFDMRERIKYWFNQSNEEASKYSDEQVDKLYWNLLAREFFALVKKFKVTGTIKSKDDVKVTPYDMNNALEESNILVDNDKRKLKGYKNEKKNKMSRSEKIEQIITKMEKLNDLWWDAEENHNQTAKQNHDTLEQEIRAEMAAIDIDFDTVGAEYEDMINKLRKMVDNNVLEESNVVVSKDITSNDYDLYDLVIPKSTVCYLEYGECSPDDFTDEELDAVNEFASEWDIVDYGDLDNTDFRRYNDISNVFGASDCVEVKAKKKRTSVNKDITSEDMDNLLTNVPEESTIVSNTVPEDIEDYYIPIEYEYVEDSDSDETRPYVDYFKHRIYLDEVMRLNTPEVIDGIEYHGYMGISNNMSYMIHINPSGDAVIVRESGADKLYNPNKKEIAVEESNIIDNDNMKMSDVDFQELYNAVNNEKKKIDEKYFYKYMNKGNKNKTFDGSGLKIFKLLPDGLKLRLYNKWKKYLSVDEINSALDKVAEKLLSNNNAIEESNMIDNDKRNPKIIKENPDGSGQVEYTRYTSHEKVRRIINVTADEMNRIKEAISSGNEDNIDNMFYDIG